MHCLHTECHMPMKNKPQVSMRFLSIRRFVKQLILTSTHKHTQQLVYMITCLLPGHTHSRALHYFHSDIYILIVVGRSSLTDSGKGRE